MIATAVAEPDWSPSFWHLQSGSWILLYVLLLMAALPHLGERDVFRYNSVGCAVLFCITLILRPICRVARKRWMSSWLALEAGALAICLVLGVFASFAIGLGTFGWVRLNGSTSMLSWLQCAMALFSWSSLYINIKQQRSLTETVSHGGLPHGVSNEQSPGIANAVSSQDQSPDRFRRFAIRTGSRIQVVHGDSVLWISAAGDYVELHTATGTYLLRETMTTLQHMLNPAAFVRIHRSRIVRWDQISELTDEDNGDYRVKLRDGSEHRSSRTFAPALRRWLNSGVEANVSSH